MWIIEKFTLIHQQNNDVKVNSYLCCGWPRWKRMKYDTFWWTQILYICSQWCCVYMIRKVHLDFFFFVLQVCHYCFTLKHFFCNIPGKKHSKWPNMQRYKTSVFKGEARATVDSWVSLLVFEFIFKRTLLMWSLISGCVMETIDIWLMGNDLFPHTSHLSLRICKSCLICPKQSQEETTVLMPLKSGH